VGAWAGRFRTAAAACCVAVAVLLITGLVAGVAYSSPVDSAKLPHGAAAYQRAQQLFSGGSLFSAVLLVAAVLLIAVTGEEPDTMGRRLLRVCLGLAALVVAAALAMAGVTIWYSSVTSGRGVVSATTGLVGDLVAVAIVAAGAAWWARKAASA